MIIADSLTFRHHGAERDALVDVSFRLGLGQLVCLMGVNGSGKSTLLTLLCGVYTSNSGTLLLNGQPLVAGGKESSRVALVPQNPDLYILGSLVEEDLLLALDPADVPARDRALALAGELGLKSVLDQPVHTLSYGQKRKLCLASALASLPDLLLLDEPFAGLDLPAILVLRELLVRNRSKGITQVVATHDLDLMADLADHFLLLQQSRLIHQGDADAVFPHLLEHGVRPPCWWFSQGKSPLWLGTSQAPVVS